MEREIATTLPLPKTRLPHPPLQLLHLLPNLAPHAQLLEEEETYKPLMSKPDSADGNRTVGSGSIYERGESVHSPSLPSPSFIAHLSPQIQQSNLRSQIYASILHSNTMMLQREGFQSIAITTLIVRNAPTLNTLSLSTLIELRPLTVESAKHSMACLK